MGEYAPSAIKDAFPIIDRAYKSAKFSGILSGGRYGYHVSRNRLRAMGKTGDYSIQAAVDKEGDGDAGSGLDVTLSDAEMKIATRRLMDACEKKDPRVQGKLREFFGTLDGKTVTGYSPYRGRRVSADKSHLWHIHLSGHRKYANDRAAWRGIAEVMAGLPLNDVGQGGGAGGGGGAKTEWWHVDPAKVSTTLWALKAGGEENVELLPGRNVEVAREVTDSRRTWLVTPSNNWVAKAYMKKGKYAGPEIKPDPKPAPKPKPVVDLSKLVAAAQRDPDRKQGGTTSGAADDVKIVEAALKAEGLLSSKYATDGSFGSTTVDAYQKWQKKLGYSGKDADGIPGKASLQKLAAKHGFTVKD
jgi:hypothetical protein